MTFLSQISPGEWLIAIVTLCLLFPAVIGSAWLILRRITYLLDVIREFPPHRHVNGKILFPKEFEPGKVEAQGAD